MIDGEWFTFFVEVFFHIEVEILEDQVQSVIAMNHVQQIYYARMVQLSKQSDFSDGSAWNALVTVLNFDFFKRYQLQKSQ